MIDSPHSEFQVPLSDLVPPTPVTRPVIVPRIGVFIVEFVVFFSRSTVITAMLSPAVKPIIMCNSVVVIGIMVNTSMLLMISFMAARLVGGLRWRIEPHQNEQCRSSCG